MPNLLKNMQITSIDLVEQGANQEADIQIVKGKDKDMTEELKEQVVELVKNLLNEQKEEDVVEEVEETLETEEVEDVEKSIDTDVLKSLESKLSIIQKANIELSKKNEELAKKLELSELTDFAKKYEPLGKDATELAKKLYEYKRVNEAFYKDYVTELDNSLSLQENSSIFKEYGTAMEGDSTSDLDEILKNYDMSDIKSYERIAIEHPELFAKYDSLYKGE